MQSRETSFPHRSGFALRADLDDPRLVADLQTCLEENQAFSGRSRLDWSRQWEYPFVLGNLPGRGDGRRILDAGSGYRFFSPLLAKHGFEVDACDLDASIGPRYDEVAAEHDIAIEFTQQDLSKMTYPDDSFDHVCCVSVLEHSRDPGAIVREFRRVLKPEGSLLLTFDVSVRGDRDIPVAKAAELLGLLDEEFEPAQPFADAALLNEEALAASQEVLRTPWFRRHRPELLPWRIVSRATLRNLMRGRIGRPFFDLAVIGVVHVKR
jgi:SAM-dependent methyltransferase